MTRLRPLIAVAAVVVGAAAAGLAVSPRTASAKDSGTIDVYNLQGDSTPIIVSVRPSGFSFLLYPQVHLPRASVSIETGTVTASASPMDPGDGTDSLPGLLVPMGEAGAENGFAGAPPPFNAPAGVIKQVSAYNSLLTTEYEHVQVVYPNPQKAGPQQGTYGADPTVAIPGGAITENGTLGRVFADTGVGTSDSGAGSAVSVPAIGLTIGRQSSHVEVHNLGTKVTSDTVSMLSGVDFNPPSIPLPSAAPAPVGGLFGAVASASPAPTGAILHIGSIVTTVHTERDAGAASATSTHRVEFGGVSVVGQAATIDDSGVHLLGQAPASLAPVISALNQMFSVAHTVNGQLPGSTPVLGGQALIPEGSMAGPQIKDLRSHNGNEAHVTITGLTLSLKGTILAPTESTNLAAVPPPIDPKNPPSVAGGAATYVISLANADSSAYGFSFPPEAPLSTATTALGATSGGLGLSSGSAGSTFEGGGSPSVSPSGPAASGSAPSTGSSPRVGPGTARAAGVSVDPALLSKGGLITLATLAELLLLGALVGSYRMRSTPRSAPSARAETNLV